LFDMARDLTAAIPRELPSTPADLSPAKLDLLYPPTLVFARAFFATLDVRPVVSGSGNVPLVGGAVMAINHTSYIDFPFAGLGARPSNRLVRFMAKESTFRNNVSGPIMKGLHHIPVDREAGASALDAAVDALRDGEIVGVYPESTISRSWEIKPFKTGAVRMAQQAGVPILPTIVWGAHRIWTKGRPRDLRRKGVPIVITVGEPVHVAAAEDPWAASDALRVRMQGLLEEAQAEYPEEPGPDEDPWWLPRRLGGTAPTLEEAEALDVADREARIAARAAQQS
jgi:1-acyl-sn-glycerol-3-phosphate acyltransferase